MADPHTPRSSPPETVLFQGRLRHSVRLASYLKALFWGALLSGAAYLIFERGWVPTAYVSWLWLAPVPSLLALLWIFLDHRSQRVRITDRLVEIERGVLTRTVDSLELWRVVDVRFRQSLLDRLLGNGQVILLGADRSHPALVLYGLNEPRRRFEQLREAVQNARQRHRPLELI